MAWFGNPRRFADKLHGFLSRLPRGPLYAVEVRNPALLTSHLTQALRAVGACPCINLLGAMPPPAAMWRLMDGDRAPALVVRWMLTRGLNYEQARERFKPFHRIAAPDPEAIASIAGLVRRCADRPAYIIANNKAEGCAPLSLLRLAQALTSARDA